MKKNQNPKSNPSHSFTKQLLTDLRALEFMLNNNIIESDIRRIGAEQEVFLVENNWSPAMLGDTIIKLTNDLHYTSELGKFNLEMNLDPHIFENDCLSQMEVQLNKLIKKLNQIAGKHDAKVLLTGILPTLRKSHIDVKNMTPNPRYKELDLAMQQLRGGKPINFRIHGLEELHIQHESIMVEACNTSFQVHFQVSPSNFAHWYNIAQTAAAPILAAAVNSPLLFGKTLWNETRIALFQQAVDTHVPGVHHRHIPSRVRFGDKWIENSVTEIFQEDVARYPMLLEQKFDEDPFEKIKAGEAPNLQALQLHNGTVYRWNRACYGISSGRPHLRIENRVLPSGPSVVDEIANATFWFGVMKGMAEKYSDISKVMAFDDVRSNFNSATRLGLNAQFLWTDKKMHPADQLILNDLLPLANQGLQDARIDSKDIDKYLGIIEKRVGNRQTGAQWILNSYSKLKNKGTQTEQLTAITAAIYKNQQTNDPVHSWKLASIHDSGGWQGSFERVEQYMDTDLYTVKENDLIELVANMMVWRHARHIMVEDNEHRLAGVVTNRTMLKYIAKGDSREDPHTSIIREIMYPNPITVTPETTTLDAISIMRKNRISCLPVIKNDRLVGLISENHFMDITRQLMEEHLSDS